MRFYKKDWQAVVGNKDAWQGRADRLTASIRFLLRHFLIAMRRWAKENPKTASHWMLFLTAAIVLMVAHGLQSLPGWGETLEKGFAYLLIAAMDMGPILAVWWMVKRHPDGTGKKPGIPWLIKAWTLMGVILGWTITAFAVMHLLHIQPKINIKTSLSETQKKMLNQRPSVQKQPVHQTEHLGNPPGDIMGDDVKDQNKANHQKGQMNRGPQKPEHHNDDGNGGKNGNKAPGKHAQLQLEKMATGSVSHDGVINQGGTAAVISGTSATKTTAAHDVGAAADEAKMDAQDLKSPRPEDPGRLLPDFGWLASVNSAYITESVPESPHG